MPVTDEITELRSGPISRTCSPDNPGQEQDQASSMGKGFITTVLAPFQRSTASRDSRKGPAGQRIAREQLAAEEGSHSPAKRGAAEHHHVSDEYTSENNYETETNRAVFKAGHYEGSTVDGKRHGEGIFSLSNGQRYTGTWANDMREGKGVERWPDGRSYHGAWKQDAFDGEGVFTWADSTSFKGTFRDYCPLEGEIFAPNGDVFVVLYDGSEPVFAGDKPEPLYKKLLSARQPEQAAEDKKDLEERVQVMRVFSAMLRDRWLQACEGGERNANPALAVDEIFMALPADVRKDIDRRVSREVSRLSREVVGRRSVDAQRGFQRGFAISGAQDDNAWLGSESDGFCALDRNVCALTRDH